MSTRIIPTFATFGLALAVAASSGAQQSPAAANPLDVVPDKMPFEIPYGPPITLERASALIAAAIAEAKKHDWKLNVAVVDSGGNLVAFQRMDGAKHAPPRRSVARPRRSRTQSR
jgi:glc operon protein GlcG